LLLSLPNRFTHVFLCAITLCVCQATFAIPAKTDIPPFGENILTTGYARALTQTPGQTRQLPPVQYIETYLQDPTNNSIRASYWSIDQRPIAYKELNFTGDSTIPDLYKMFDYRRGRGYRVEVTRSTAIIQGLMMDNKNTVQVYREKKLPITENTVIDASFNRVVLKNWDRLITGKSLRVNFLQADKNRLVPLKIKKTRCKSKDRLCLKISLDNFLLQALVPKLSMEYGLNDQRLLHFSGLGPVLTKKGKGFPVNINYKY